MPIYAYRCETCGFQQDVLQKMSDARLVKCPSCGADTFQKQVTAAGFQLKGSGWYVTDFRNPAVKDGGKKSEASAPDGKGDGKGEDGGSAAKSDAQGDAPAAAPAATPAPAVDAKPAPPAAKPAPPPGGTK